MTENERLSAESGTVPEEIGPRREEVWKWRFWVPGIHMDSNHNLGLASFPNTLPKCFTLSIYFSLIIISVLSFVMSKGICIVLSH